MAKSLLVHAGVVAAVLGCIGGAGATVGGCGGIEPGDYVIYRVSFGKMSQSSGCYSPAKVPPNEKYDSTTYRKSATCIMFAGQEDARYLDDGDETLDGTQSGDNFTFSGKTVDVNYSNTMGDGTGAKTTTSTVVTVEMTQDGNAVTGKATTKTTTK